MKENEKEAPTEAEIKDAFDKVESLEAENRKLSEEVEILEKKRQGYARELESAEASLKEAKATIEKLEVEFEGYYQANTKLRDKIGKVEAERDALVGKATVLMEALKDLRGAVVQACKTGSIPAEPFIRAGNIIQSEENDGICPTCQKLELISRIRHKGKSPRCQGGEMIHLWLCYLGLHLADDGLNSGLHTFCRCCGKQLCRHLCRHR